MEKKKHRKLLNLVDELEGDKVVWIIALMLILISIVCIFSSSSRLVTARVSRLDIVWDQLKTVLIGLGIIILCYEIRSVKVFRWFSKWGFIISLLLLLFLAVGPRSGYIRSASVNGARRVIMFGGKQIFVFEMIKVMMVMYLAWAVEAIQKGKLTIVEKLRKYPRFKWVESDFAKRSIYLYVPILAVTFLMVDGSGSAAILMAGIMVITILMGGTGLRDVSAVVLLVLVVFGLSYGIYEISDHKKMKRVETIVNRLSDKNSIENLTIRYHEAAPGQPRRDVLDTLRQPYSALIAVKEGGVLGKGPGQSTQRLIVPDMSEDYMFSFIIEEYGLWGALIIIFLYVSLLARGSLIARNCGDDMFAKTAVAGLTLLITMQAFLHMCVNVNIGPKTGQTLPLISHGSSAFLCFCVAFGVLLAISRIAQKNIAREEAKAEPLVNADNGAAETLNELDAFESEI